MKNVDSKVVCPFCGDEIQGDAVSCPSCGSDEKTGWSDSTYLDNIELADNLDYDQILEKEFGYESVKKKPQLHWQAVTGFVMLFVLVVILLRSLF